VYPNAVLLLIGTNDITLGNISSYKSNLTSLVGKILELRPDTHLILGRLIPFVGHATEVAEANSDINLVANYYQGLGKNISICDLNTSFPANGLISDGCHPNDAGYAWMADQWHTALQSSFATSVPEPNALVLLGVCIVTGTILWILFRFWKQRVKNMGDAH
jgi:lysophospholipase L1-like esterase